MRSDFHFYAIYLVCSMLGIREEDKNAISFSSEYVDHADGNDVSNGVTTAHIALSTNNFVIEDGFEIWAAFHFLPAGRGVSLGEKMKCWPSTRFVATPPEDVIEALQGETALGADALIDWILSVDYDPFLTGIALHILADTWSHRQFNGLYSHENNITILSSKTKEQLRNSKSESIAPLLVDAAKNFALDHLFMGHGEAEHLPDIPTEIWSFLDAKRKICHRHNLTQSCEPALQQAIGILRSLIEMNPVIAPTHSLKNVNMGLLLSQLEQHSDSNRPVEHIPSYDNCSKDKNVLSMFHSAARKFLDFYHENVLDAILQKGYGQFRQCR